LIVGQDAVGKTSLVKILVFDQTADPRETKTEGINIVKRWSISGDDVDDSASEIMMNIWDFGGQEIMHSTHQFFLTKRSLYLVVLDARKGENESNIHYWLKIVQSYGGDAPIIVVTNKNEPPHYLELNERRLMLDYAPNLRGLCKVSCATGMGVPELRTAIAREVVALPHVRDELPLSFFKVKEALEERADDYINIGHYETICHEHGVTSGRDQELLLRFLHDLGSMLNFDDPGSLMSYATPMCSNRNG
jgi:internalin A